MKNSEPAVAEVASAPSIMSTREAVIPAGPTWEKVAKRLATLLFLGVLFLPVLPAALGVFSRRQALAKAEV